LNEPIRTCVGCGQRDRQRSLVRFVMAGGRLALDARPGRQPGRGAYLHHASSCWSTFVRRRGAVRSLRVSPAAAQREELVATLSGVAEGSR
jgi:uncharacterized protein